MNQEQPKNDLERNFHYSKHRAFFGMLIGIGAIVALWKSSTSLDLSEFSRRFKWHLLIVPFFLHALTLIIAWIQILLTLRTLYPVKAGEIARRYYLSLVTGMLLPNTLNEAVIIPILHRSGLQLHAATAAFTASKMSNTIFLLTVAAASLIITGRSAQEISLPVTVLAVLLIPFVVIIVGPARRLVRRLAERALTRWLKYLEAFSLVVRYSRARMALLFVTGALKGVLGFTYLWVILHALGGRTPFHILAGASAIGTLAGIMSLTPRNLGVYEGCLAFFTAGHGDSARLLVLSSLVARLIGNLDIVISFLLVKGVDFIASQRSKFRTGEIT